MQDKRTLSALNGLRFFAIFHLVLFHFHDGHLSGELPAAGWALLPGPLLGIIRSGHTSTGLFFILSGFILTYVYADRQTGLLRTSLSRFIRLRLFRVVPLHVTLLLVLLPFISLTPPEWTVGAWLLSASLLQAFVPPAVLTWNIPAWAASALLLYYVLFPGMLRLTRSWSPAALVGGILAATAASWSLALGYLALAPDGVSSPGPQEALTRLVWLKYHPLTWLPFFFAGVCAGRLMNTPVSAALSRVSDAVAIILLVLISVGDALPYVWLRHGMLLPLQVALITGLAHDRSATARLMARPVFQDLGRVSFSIYLVHFPILSFAAAGLMLTGLSGLGVGATLGLVLLILVASRLIDRRFAEPAQRWLKARFLPAPSSSTTVARSA